MFNSRVREAFEFLESAVAAAKIHFYGMATWNAFRQGEMNRIFFRSPRWSRLRGTSREDRTTSGSCNCRATWA